MWTMKTPIYRRMAPDKKQTPSYQWLREQATTMLRRGQWHDAISSARRGQALRFPDFLIIGAQKSGTSWLRFTLAEHPEVGFPKAPFEMHFFDKKYHLGLNWYLRQFVGIDKPIVGDKTPAYALLPEHRIRLLMQAAPKIKIIYVVRNPIDRAWSQARMIFFGRLGHGAEQVHQMEDDIAQFFKSAFCRSRGAYLATVDRWTQHTPEAQFKVFFYDDLNKDVNLFGNQVATFLNVEPDVDWASLQPEVKPQLGTKVELTLRLRQVLVDLYADEIEDMIDRWGDGIAHWRAS